MMKPYFIYLRFSTLLFLFLMVSFIILPGSAFSKPTIQYIQINNLKFRTFVNKDLIKKNENVTRLIIVIHGMLRNAKDYFNHIEEVSEKNQEAKSTLIIAPWFITKKELNANDELFWSKGGWKRGNDSINKKKQTSSFECIDIIIKNITESGFFPNLKNIIVTGHSAGGQFVERYAAGSDIESTLGHNFKVKYAPSNSSSFIYFDSKRPFMNAHGKVTFTTPGKNTVSKCKKYNDYKYGLDKKNSYMSRWKNADIIKRYLSKNIYYFLGENDTGPKNLDESCEGMLQGKNRFTRSVNFQKYLDTFYPAHKHSLLIIKKTGHNSKAIYNSIEAQRILFL